MRAVKKESDIVKSEVKRKRAASFSSASEAEVEVVESRNKRKRHAGGAHEVIVLD